MTYEELNKEPLVSIIIAVYNGEQYLAEAIESIVEQTYKNFEIIIIDGNSTDGTLDIIKQYSPYISYWNSEKDRGIYDAWNKGLAIAKGDWICFLGSDDSFLSHAIETYINFINQHRLQGADYISSKVQLVSPESNPLRLFGSAWDWKRFQIYMNVAHVGSFHNKDLFKKYGLYNISYKIAADYEYLLRAKNTLKASFIDAVTVKMRIGGTSLKNTKVFQESFIAKYKTGGRPFILCFCDYIIARTKFFIKILFFNK